MPNKYNYTMYEGFSRWLTIRPAQGSYIAVAFLICFFTAGAQGNTLEFQDQDTLPHPENIVFAKQHVGIISKDDRYFVLERKTDRLQQVGVENFARQFPSPWPPKPYESLQTKEILRSSSGHEFEQHPAYCDEGEHEANELRYLQRPFLTVLKPCTSVAMLEIVDRYIWWGTIRPGEGGDGRGEGLVVQLFGKTQKVNSLTAQSGLTGDRIRVVRDDPFTNTVWIATEWGLNQIDRHFRVIWGRYWYEDFETSTRKSQTLLSTGKRASNPFAVLGRELAVRDWPAFSQAIEKISPSIRNTFKLYEFHMSGFCRPTLSVEMNGLVPFFIEAAQSNAPNVQNFGLSNLCKFDDPRVDSFMDTMAH